MINRTGKEMVHCVIEYEDNPSGIFNVGTQLNGIATLILHKSEKVACKNSHRRINKKVFFIHFIYLFMKQSHWRYVGWPIANGLL